MREPCSSELLVIDLDNTLYAADNGVFARMDTRMTAFISQALQLEEEEANRLRINYWKKYGSTLRGLMLHHDMQAEDFLHDVHNIDAHELLQPNQLLDVALSALTGRKVIHTNGTCEHAECILSALGVRHHFETIYDIRYNEYFPKPCANTLKMLLDDEGVSPAQVLVLDDMQENLAVAQKLGAKTCWISSQHDAHHWDYQASSLEAFVFDTIA
ncbi:MAG: pyrimidine 5'-nucleotidase [Mariprofundaceae bacterium]|nr:pyrimidine 5'-nucleotidase [Mariprofundaceae bacterium]